jgi:hypothetical protein
MKKIIIFLFSISVALGQNVSDVLIKNLTYVEDTGKKTINWLWLSSRFGWNWR